MEQREVEIDLIDFMYEVLSHWRGLLAVVLIGAVLGGGYSYVKSASAAQVVSEPATLEMYEEQLTAREIADVKTLLLYDQMAASYATDPFMQLDASAVPEGTLILSISQDDNNGNVAQAIRRLVTSSEYYSYLTEKTGYTSDMSKLFIDSGVTVGAADATKVVQSLEDALNAAASSDTVAITCVGESEEFCKNVLQDTLSYLESKKTELVSVYGDYAIQTLSDSVNVVSDSRVSALQADAVAKYTANKTARDTLDKAISEQQRAYYELLMAGEEATESTVEQAVAVKPQVSKKMIALGAIGLLFLYGIYLFMAYAFNGKWQNHSSYQETYGLTDLGTIRKTGAKQKQGLDAVIARGRLRGMKELSVEEAVDTLSSSIALQTEKEKINTLAFVGGNYGEETESQMKALAEALQKKNADISVKTLYDVSYNATAIDQLAGVDAVVIVETAAKSRISEMTKEILLLTNQKIRILGGVTI
ncbi:hypothetical protein SAMN02910301_0391 [Lachnospiraceae bacterium XBD2001]|nr:hypothetical protein SAMN02910301_0391 [Lachnospiraceae bacterium XBD2001]